MNGLRRILTVQDISCVGKCSLAAALPVISALGVECSVLPTAVLSTHTGGFGTPAVRDLTDSFEDFAEHWASAALSFDAVYSGYLGSIDQIEKTERLLERFAPDGVHAIVDPVMADGGRLYSRFGAEFVERMRGLCAKATLVLPNITEAALLTGSEYIPDGDERYIRGLLEKLCGIGARCAAVTGVVRGDEIGASVLDPETGELYSAFEKRERASFHGTGDIFASVVTAALARGRSLQEAVGTAVMFTAECIRASSDLPENRRYGTAFERRLGLLTRLSEEWSE